MDEYNMKYGGTIIDILLLSPSVPFFPLPVSVSLYIFLVWSVSVSFLLLTVCKMLLCTFMCLCVCARCIYVWICKTMCIVGSQEEFGFLLSHFLAYIPETGSLVETRVRLGANKPQWCSCTQKSHPFMYVLGIWTLVLMLTSQHSYQWKCVPSPMNFSWF